MSIPSPIPLLLNHIPTLPLPLRVRYRSRGIKLGICVWDARRKKGCNTLPNGVVKCSKEQGWYTDLLAVDEEYTFCKTMFWSAKNVA